MKLLRIVLSLIPDVIFIAGLCLLGYGLFLYMPWVSYAVCGFILMTVGVLSGRAEKEPKQ